MNYRKSGERDSYLHYFLELLGICYGVNWRLAQTFESNVHILCRLTQRNGHLAAGAEVLEPALDAEMLLRIYRNMVGMHTFDTIMNDAQQQGSMPCTSFLHSLAIPCEILIRT